MARITERLGEIATATPLTRDPAILESSALYVQGLARQLLALGPSLTALDDAIAQRVAAHPDADLFTAVPGAGAALAPRLLVAFGTDRTRFPTAADLQKVPGLRRSPSAVGRSAASIGAGPRPPFCARPFRNLPTTPFSSVSGRAPSISNSVTAARPIMPRCEASPSSGFAFSGAAGRTTFPTTTRAMNAR